MYLYGNLWLVKDYMSSDRTNFDMALKIKGGGKGAGVAHAESSDHTTPKI